MLNVTFQRSTSFQCKWWPHLWMFVVSRIMLPSNRLFFAWWFGKKISSCLFINIYGSLGLPITFKIINGKLVNLVQVRLRAFCAHLIGHKISTNLDNETLFSHSNSLTNRKSNSHENRCLAPLRLFYSIHLFGCWIHSDDIYNNPWPSWMLKCYRRLLIWYLILLSLHIYTMYISHVCKRISG